MKSVCIQSFSGPYFRLFGLNTERYLRVSLHKYLSVFSLNAGKYGPGKLQIRTLLTLGCVSREYLFSVRLTHSVLALLS